MIFRLGYVAMTLSLKDCSPSGTVTVTNFNKLPDWETKIHRLRKISGENIKNTLRILRYNEAYNIKIYRFTSKLIPLATHPVIDDWDYAAEFETQLKELGELVRLKDMRVSAHPDHFTLINSTNEKVIDDAIKDLDYHVKIFEAMGLEEYRYKLVMHVGGLYKNKIPSIERFKENFVKLPERIRNRIILENDDKSYTASDVLGICKELKIPMVLDVHHHNCVNNGERLEDILPEIFDTWNTEYFVPKIHFSSPKNEKDFRSHADYIELNEFLKFLDISKKTGRNFDVMLEAKNKDMALLRLSEELKGIEYIKSISESEFELE